ncbi:RecX family transcriptional regulator [Tsuneonella sp. YG55]|uniref:RecX family transcriptional regulator n=1 Tax=Tsuneonella litorea TaxID=2976475 RepID=A0A9X3AA17_9SPHN|nr:RecX family transcriptional regulator [Tsuneonella litorea]MCT2559440.1 RecX family transcriptional regulator [Tsuneonella litorea]
MSRRPARERRPPPPLTPEKLEEAALAYVARFATSAAKVEQYLARKLRERGWDGARPAEPKAIVERFVELGYIDDEAWARARGSSLLRRGYGARRVDQALGAAGIDEALRDAVRADESDLRRAAIALAQRRRLGPWGAELPDRAARERQIAAMLRAGHGFDAARAVIDAATVAEAEAWASEAEENP